MFKNRYVIIFLFSITVVPVHGMIRLPGVNQAAISAVAKLHLCNSKPIDKISCNVSLSSDVIQQSVRDIAAPKARTYCSGGFSGMFKRTPICLNMRQKEQELTFLRAVRSGDIDCVVRSINSGVDLNCKVPFGEAYPGSTALIITARLNNIKMMDLLLNQVDDEQLRLGVNAQSREGVTALCWAAHHNNVEMIQFLIEHGAVINATSENPLFWAIGDSPLMRNHNNSIEVIAYLLEAGAVIDDKIMQRALSAKNQRVIDLLTYWKDHKEINPDVVLTALDEHNHDYAHDSESAKSSSVDDAKTYNFKPCVIGMGMFAGGYGLYQLLLDGQVDNQSSECKDEVVKNMSTPKLEQEVNAVIQAVNHFDIMHYPKRFIELVMRLIAKIDDTLQIYDLYKSQRLYISKVQQATIDRSKQLLESLRYKLEKDKIQAQKILEI